MLTTAMSTRAPVSWAAMPMMRWAALSPMWKATYTRWVMPVAAAPAQTLGQEPTEQAMKAKYRLNELTEHVNHRSETYVLLTIAVMTWGDDI